ncbi:MAG: TspO/MBR family protein [Algibacter sp.]|uniref:TspO/MBR family protein n=1 Tax=Algibacter sp. TaxID=1872428 RepID=UPI0032996FC3
MKLLKYFVIFLTINLSALAIGSWLMDNGPQSNWYTTLNKAPWTPPGWFFGVAWTTIMICFSVYMAYLYKRVSTIYILSLFAVQSFLNVIWNYIFFAQHLVLVGLITLIALTLVIVSFTLIYKKDMRLKTLLIIPYLIWICVATSLNGYILLNN